MDNQSLFELHSFAGAATAAVDDDANWLSAAACEDDSHGSPSVLQIAASEWHPENPFPVAVDSKSNRPCRASDKGKAVACFSVIQRRLGMALSMTTAADARVLVNGLPALSLTVLSPRDCVVLAPGVHSYVTERFRPHIGAPLPEMVGKKCPFCRIPVTKDTSVATCRCGVPYHNEGSESHPAIDDAERLNCLAKVRVCLSCGRPVTLEESLVWDPNSL